MGGKLGIYECQQWVDLSHSHLLPPEKNITRYLQVLVEPLKALK